jgi:hypothetical protein
MWRIEFSSADFLPYLPEEAQVNPGVYGFELAYWLSQALVKSGVVTSYPISEDWGWLLEYVEGDLEVTIGCASMANEGEGYAAQPVSWSIFARPHRSVRKLFGKNPEVQAPSSLTGAIEAALDSKGIEVRCVEA